MSTILHCVRAAIECLLVLPLLPVIGLMWAASAITSEPSDDAPHPAQPQPSSPPQPVAAPRPSPRYVKRQWRRCKQQLLTRLLGQGDFVTEWQLR